MRSIPGAPTVMVEDMEKKPPDALGVAIPSNSTGDETNQAEVTETEKTSTGGLRGMMGRLGL